MHNDPGNRGPPAGTIQEHLVLHVAVRGGTVDPGTVKPLVAVWIDDVPAWGVVDAALSATGRAVRSDVSVAASIPGPLGPAIDRLVPLGRVGVVSEPSLKQDISLPLCDPPPG